MQRAPVSDLYTDRRLPMAGCTPGRAGNHAKLHKQTNTGRRRDSGDTNHAAMARGRTRAGDLVIETTKPNIVLRLRALTV